MNKNNKVLMLVGVVIVVALIVTAFIVLKNNMSAGDDKPVVTTPISPQELTLSLDQKGSTLGLGITPIALVEDSRCPSDVVCIWAGTVKVRTSLESSLGKVDQIFELNKPVTTDGIDITLINVLPGTLANETIATSSYHFVFRFEDRSESDKVVVTVSGITFAYPDDFGLAVTKEQILATSYIPACEDGFDYCLYYNNTAFDRTNFDSAGLRIEKRVDITSENVCMTMPPNGYKSLTPVVNKKVSYATSVFSPVGDAGAGHYASGSVYRLFIATTTCLEFETRIGESQFANYETGTIQEFTKDKRLLVENKLKSILDGVAISKTGEKVVFPMVDVK